MLNISYCCFVQPLHPMLCIRHSSSGGVQYSPSLPVLTSLGNTAHPAPFWILLTSLQLRRRHITSTKSNSLFTIPLAVIHTHIQPHTQRKQHTHGTKTRANNARHSILRGVLVQEDIRADKTHSISASHKDRRQDSALVLVGRIIIVPR